MLTCPCPANLGPMLTSLPMADFEFCSPYHCPLIQYLLLEKCPLGRSMFLISPSPALPSHHIASAVPPSQFPSTLQLFQKLMRNKISVDNHQGCLLLGWGTRETWDPMRVGGTVLRAQNRSHGLCHGSNGSTNSLGRSCSRSRLHSRCPTLFLGPILE